MSADARGHRLLGRVIEWSVANRVLVLGVAAALAAAGLWAMLRTPVDAIPDLSDVQVNVMTEWPGQAAQLVEDQITYPLSTEMLKVPHTKLVHGMSQFGISAVHVVFDEGTDLYWARSRVLEYLNSVRDKLPADAQPMLGPDATGVGWVMQYILTDTTGRLNLAELRSLQDWTVRPALTAVPGVAEIAALGGFVKEYQVEVRPAALLAYGIPMEKVAQAVRASNQDVGGRELELGGAQYVVRGRGRFADLDDIRAVAIGTGSGGTPIIVGDVADVHVGPAIRRGIADLSGRGEIVTGWVVMRYGENPLAVIRRVKARMTALQPALPPGVVFVDGYDRSELIQGAIATLRAKLVEESIIVALVAVLFLLHLRSAFVAIVTLPIGVLMAFLATRALGLSANIMSLGGLALSLGVMVDGAIVMVENMHKHLERAHRRGEDPRASAVTWRAAVESAREVGPSLFVTLLLIVVSFLPIFALTDQEGRLFSPLAWTKTLSMAAAALLAVTLVPVLMGFLIRGRIRPERENPVSRALIWVYRPVLRLALHNRLATILIAIAIAIVTLVPWTQLGSEFMPPLNEGSIMDMPSLAPGIGVSQAKALLVQRDAALARIPEVRMVLGKIGRAETATDMAPMEMLESIAILKDRARWRPGVTYDSIVAEANATVRSPGVANMWSMPIKNRIDMLSTGVKTSVGVKVFGPDLRVADGIGKQLEPILGRVRGANSVFAEQAMQGRYLDVTLDRAAAARYGLTGDEVQMALSTAVGGMDAGEVIEGRERYHVLVRYPREYRDVASKLADVLVAVPSGAQVRLGELATITVAKGATLIKSENAIPTTVVYVDVRNRDIGGYVNDARALVDREVHLPQGYRLVWSGQYESMERATSRMRLVIPLTLAVIFLLLYTHFRSAAATALIMLSLPFALVGGVWLLWMLHYNVSVAVAVGLIALAGLAVETAVVMLIYLDHAYADHRQRGAMRTRADLYDAVEYGAVERVRPKMMTVTAIMAGLVPILWSNGTGADVMKRIAAPMVGGMVSSTLLTLLVVPVVYSLWKERTIGRTESDAVNEPSHRTSVQGNTKVG